MTDIEFNGSCQENVGSYEINLALTEVASGDQIWKSSRRLAFSSTTQNLWIRLRSGEVVLKGETWYLLKFDIKVNNLFKLAPDSLVKLERLTSLTLLCRALHLFIRSTLWGKRTWNITLEAQSQVSRSSATPCNDFPVKGMQDGANFTA